MAKNVTILAFDGLRFEVGQGRLDVSRVTMEFFGLVKISKRIGYIRRGIRKIHWEKEIRRMIAR